MPDQNKSDGKKRRSAKTPHVDRERKTLDHAKPQVTSITFSSPAKRIVAWRGALYGYRGQRWSSALAYERDLVEALR